MRELFAATFSELQREHLEKAKAQPPELKAIFDQLGEIDALIQDAAPERPLDQVNKVDLAILRISVFELLSQDTPPKVVIDEAIEIAKSYSTESAPKFVNGVLATVVKTLKKSL
jgi:N utilization substance protein B